MLKSLSIKNFAIIEDIFIDFNEGMTVLTGETGAGKSIIIDAISMLIGHRASADFVRNGSKKAHISGEFYIINDEIKEKLHAYDIECDNTLIIDRTIYKEGRSNIRLNGVISPLSLVKELKGYLVDIHSQHDNTVFLDKSKHIDLLDNFIGDDHKKVIEEYKSKYKKLVKLQKELSKFEQENNESLLEIYSYQLKEIEDANITEDEEDILNEQKKVIQNIERINNSVNLISSNLSGNGSIMDMLYEIKNELGSLTEFKDEYSKLHEQVSDIYYQLEDVSNSIGNEYFDDDSEVNIDEIESRLFLIQKLKMKYGGSVSKLMKSRDELSNKIEAINNKDQMLENYKNEIESLTIECEELANIISISRNNEKEILEKSISDILKGLYMENCLVEFNIHKSDTLLPNGNDEVEMYVRTNIGETMKPLVKIASGGELSRIMLAIKAVLLNYQNISTIIFDEIDSGVSGKVGSSFADVMKEISKNTQVLTITHLPQVASKSDNHYQVYKEVQNDKTVTIVKDLNKEERIREIASMLSSKEVTEESLEYAANLLNS